MSTATAKRGPGRPKKVVSPAAEEPTVIDFGPEDPELTPEEGEEVAQVAQESEPIITQGDLARAIHALAKGQEALVNSQVRKVPYANHKPRSAFNPQGKKKRKLTRVCYQNGYVMNVVLLHDREIELLNTVQGGKYLNGLVTVKIDDRGSETTLNIIYKNKTVDERMALKSEFRNLKEFLERAVKEGPMQD